MYRFTGRNARVVKQAHDFAAIQVARLCQERHIKEEDALPFLARQILRLHREGEQDARRLANRAISALREQLQMRESALRVARPSDPD